MHGNFQLETPKVRDHSLELGIDGTLMLKKYGVRSWTGFNWLRVGNSGEHLYTRYSNFGFRKRRGIFRAPEGILAAGDETRSMMYVRVLWVVNGRVSNLWKD